MKPPPPEIAKPIAAAVTEYGEASRRWGMAVVDGRGFAAADRRHWAAFRVVLGLVHHGEDRVVPIESLAPVAAP